MKREVLVIFCIITLCGLVLATNTGTVKAYQAGFDVEDYTAVNDVTVDGTWTTDIEWDDAAQYELGGDLNGIFRLKYIIDPGFTWVNQYYLIELLDDTTNDAGDYYQICYAAATSLFGTPAGGTTPQTDCYMFNYTGHSTTSSLTVYNGDGSAWIEYTTWESPADFEAADSISASKLSSTPHWIAEIKVEHMAFNINPEFWIRVAAFDASNSAAGVQAWPPEASPDSPDEWALMTSFQTAFPETIGFGVMVILSSVAVMVGSRYLWKRSRIERHNSRKQY